jgi:glycosyltransferase involved in cell wall biosynthesis
MNRIFIQIASYRDPELVPTIRHCISKAKYPERLTFGICWQRDETESLEELTDNKAIRVIDVNYTESKGACWARNLTQSLYDGEEFTMQIDSHSRFIQDWDVVLLEIWSSLNDPKAILTCYPPNYGPLLPEDRWYHTPQICNVYKFTHRYTVSQPKDMPDLAERTSPRRGVFVAAGFIFGSASIIKDVPYDPEFYFTGEEIAITLRLFTSGYNIYHPHKLILHHFYSRPDNSKHWVDHTDWGILDYTAHQRLDSLLGHNDIDLGIYGLGTKRTLEDFKNYAGIDYKNGIIHEYTEKGGEPPIEYDEEGWNNVKGNYSEVLKWDPEAIDKEDDVTFWAFIVKDQFDIAIHRWDALTKEHPEIINGEIREYLFQFEHNIVKQIPTTLLIWPYSASKGWIKSTTFPV